MMKRYKTILFWGIVFCSMFLYLQLANRYLFYYEEQLQFFLFSKAYAIETIGQPGGLSLYLARFLTQFYLLPFAGALISSLLLTTIGCVVQAALQRLTPDNPRYLFYALPSLSLLVMHLDADYLLQGTVSYLFMACSFYLYTRLSFSRKRFFLGPALALSLFFAAGSIASLFAVSVIVWEVLTRPKGWYLALSTGLIVFVTAFLSLWSACAGEYRMVLLPDAYYDPLVRIHKIYLSWYALPGSMILIYFLRNKKKTTSKAGAAWFTCQLLLSLYLLYMTHIFSYDPVIKNNMEQDYYARTKQWDKIISTFPSKDFNLQTFNVLNMALAQKGMLGEKLFSYNQGGSGYLVADWDLTVQNAIALSDVYYMTGDIASSQRFAFEGYVSSFKGGNVRLLRRLVETNLILGACPVAEKYIKLLKQTLFHRKWATEQSRFLYNHTALENDRVLGNKRKALCKGGLHGISVKPEGALEQQAVNNPSNPVAIEYLAASYLLDKDLKNYRRILEAYYATKTWPRLSACMQEAVIALEEDDPGYWLRYGVNTTVEQRYNKFHHDIHTLQHHINFHEQIAKAYGNTYWYYFMFKK